MPSSMYTLHTKDANYLFTYVNHICFGPNASLNSLHVVIFSCKQMLGISRSLRADQTALGAGAASRKAADLPASGSSNKGALKLEDD